MIENHRKRKRIWISATTILIALVQTVVAFPVVVHRPYTTALHAVVKYQNDTSVQLMEATSKPWRRRNARSASEGIRSNGNRTELQLSSILDKAGVVDLQSRQYAARTITGLINALADEVSDLEVEVDAQAGTPIWNKQVNSIRIKFSRLGFKPIRMGGHSSVFKDTGIFGRQRREEYLLCADSAFREIDLDDSGGLDREELAIALAMATSSTKTPSKAIEVLADDLLKLYDANGDGVVDRTEYQKLVEDMAALQKADSEEKKSDTGWFSSIRGLVSGVFGREQAESDEELMERAAQQVSELMTLNGEVLSHLNETQDYVNLETDLSIAKSLGTITFSDLRLDLRRLIFGGIPILKRVTPGGSLILEPFTATAEGSFTREDMLDSFYLDFGLRRLVARALRRRVRSFRDFIDGAVFHGRSWNAASKSAPVVEVPKITDIEFDDQNRLIITGRVIVKTRSDAPQIEQAFKVRTKLGTRADGQVIRLVEPELAFVLECPKSWEKNVEKTCEYLGIPTPPRPQPLYSFFPIYSPFKVEDNDGFDMGQDNCIKSIYVKDGALRFEISAVLRPGRFLGSHYIAFSIPNRSFIITLDRVKNGMRAARQAKKYKESVQKEIRKRRQPNKIQDANVVAKTLEPQSVRPPPPKSFFSRFVDGWSQVGTEDEKLGTSIRDFFGRQTNND